MNKFLYPIVIANSTQDPAGSFEEGSVYYNSSLKVLRHYQDGSWRFLPNFASLVGIPTPILVSGLGVCPYMMNASANTTLAMANNTTYWIPFVVNRKTTVTELAISVSTASANSSQSVGVYSSTTTNLKPTTLLGSVTLSTASTGLKVGVLNSPIDLYPNVYWVAIASSGTPTLNALPVAASATLALNGTTRINHYRSTGTTLPNDATGVTFTANNSSLPIVFFTISF